MECKKRQTYGVYGESPAEGAGGSVTIENMGDARITERQDTWGSVLGTGAGTVFRWLRGKPGRNERVFHGLRSGASAFLKALASTLRVLFLEVSGFIFLCFSVAVVSAFFREYKKYEMHQAGLERVILVGAIGAMFLYFGLSSFWRARRKR